MFVDLKWQQHNTAISLQLTILTNQEFILFLWEYFIN